MPITLQYNSLPSRPTWTLVAPSTNGLPAVSTAQVKWGTTSASFDGTAKGIAFTGSTSATTAVNAGGLIPTGTGMSFTLEMWIYIPTANLGTQRAIYDAGQGGVGIGIRNTNVLYFGQAGVSYGIQTSTAIAGNTWTHIAFMISGSTNYIFINGVATSGATSNYSFTNPQGGVVAPAVGINGYGDRFIGFMQDIRISNGAIYATGGFTPPAAPLTNTAQTVLLIPCYDGTIADTPGTTAGGITIQYANIASTPRTAKTLATRIGKSFPTSSAPPVSNLGGMNAIDFSGGGKAFQLDNVNANWGATSTNSTDGGLNDKLWFQNLGQFTIEFWVYFSAVNPQIGIIEFGTAGPAIGFRTSTSIYLANSGSSYLYNPNLAAAIVTGQWYHVAFTRESNNLYGWFNGVSLGAPYTGAPNFTGSGAPFFGAGNGSNDLNGYMQDIRISNIARYSPGVNFTPATSPFVNDANTLLLVHGSSPITDDNVTITSGGITIQY